MLSKNDKLKLIEKVPFWWHTIDFGEGVLTNGRCFGSREQSLYFQKIILSAIPKKLSNKTVLDIGCWDGFYSFECEKRGAKVTAIDNNQQEKFVEEVYGKKRVKVTDSFHVAKKLLMSNVEFRQLDLYNLERLRKKFDIILLLQVFYHLKDPLKALDILYKITNEMLIIESHYIKTKTSVPVMRFYPGQELNNDPTNWWGPNIPCLLAMIKSVGFKKVAVFKKYYENNNRVILKACK